MKKIQIFIFIIIGLATMNPVFAGKDYKQPLFSLEFSVYGAGADIRLNDIPVYYHDVRGQVSSQKPVPESIIDGENVLVIKSFPLEENDNQYQKGAYIEAIISVREKNAPLNDNEPVLQLKLNPADSEDVFFEGSLSKVGDMLPVILSHTNKQTVVERRTYIKSPYPRWAWQDGKTIEDTPENFDSLLEKYKEIWGILNSGNMKEINQIYDLAAQEFSWAYHYQANKYGHRLMNTGGLVGDDEWQLGDINKILKKVNFRITIYANGKLAHLLDEDGEPSLITYLNKKVKMINTQKFSFYKNKADEWIMIR